MAPLFRTNDRGGKIVVVQDAGAGSSGKGLLNQYLAETFPWNIVTCNFMPNAGHTMVLHNGTRVVTQQIPTGFLNRTAMLFLNAGCAIDVDTLLKEVELLATIGYDVRDRLFIHPHATVIEEQDRQTERAQLSSGSTFKGCGAALARKVMRSACLAKDAEPLRQFISHEFQERMTEAALGGANILVEGAQGIDLDVNHAEYPFCTSRQTIPAQLVADANVPINLVSNVILNWRPQPIRISNTSAADGTTKFSGNCFGAPEISWEDVATRAGYTFDEFMELYGHSLMTTVTKKTRRVFEFPKDRAASVFRMTGGEGFVINSLNFLNWIDRDSRGVSSKVMAWLLANWSDEMIRSLKIIRWGESPSDVGLVDIPPQALHEARLVHEAGA